MAGEELRINVEPLRKYSIMVATPCYGGAINMNFDHSMKNLHAMLLQAGIAHEFRKIGNESLIPRARNIMAGAFLESQHTHLLFIDGDIEFDPKDVFMLLYLDKEVIGGAYPMKGIDWKQIKELVLKHPDIPPEELSSAGAKWPISLYTDRHVLEPFKPIVVPELANGFMMIKREAFEKIKSIAESYDKGLHERDYGKRFYDFFPCRIYNDRYESEDYGFCRLWRQVGGEVWLCPWMEFTHWGTFGFKGSLHKALELLNRDSLEWAELETTTKEN